MSSLKDFSTRECLVGIIWIIEKPHKSSQSLAAKLQGDFAVRLIGSVDSYLRLCRLVQKPLPDALVIDCDDLELNFQEIESKTMQGLPHALRIFVFKEDGKHKEADRHSLGLKVSEGENNLDFVKELRERLAVRKNSGKQLLQYRTLELDAERFSLKIQGEDEEISLPSKEARILKYMMEHPRQCLGRDELKDAVWGGLAVSSRTIDSHISRLRKRLNSAAVDIQNIYGGGYILE